MVDVDELEIELRSPEEVAARCVILAALIRRLWIETLAQTSIDEELAGEAFDVRGWLQTEELWPQLTTSEIAFLDRPVGHLDDDEVATVAWQAEGLATLGWSLSLSDRLPPGDLSDVEAVVKSVPAPWDKTSNWLRGAALRSEAEIVHERDRAEMFDWRIGIEAPRRDSSGQERDEFAQAIADVAHEAAASGLGEGIRDGDFTIGGVPMEAFDAQGLERLAALAEERLRAMNWLCGFGDSWDRVPLDI